MRHREFTEMEYDFNLLQYGCTVCPSGWGMKNTNAIFYRMYYIYGGEACYRTEEGAVPFEAGHFYILPLMRPYTLWHNWERPLEVLWFHVEMKQEYFSRLEDIEIKEDSALFHLLQAMQALFGRPELHPYITRLFLDYLNILRMECSFQTVRSRRMQKTAAYIEEHLQENITVSSMARHVGMERSYFSRRFKEVFHMPPARYLYAKRMNQAAKLLLKGERVSDVADQVGYCDNKAFSRAFKHYMEMSPAQYKKSHIEQP